MIPFNEIAAVSGKSGLYRVINPTRTGVILEAMDESKKKLVVGMQAKVSVLSDISIYTTDAEGSVPLEEVFRKIYAEFGDDTGLSRQSDAEELKSFMKFVLPDYDEGQVYVSDIKKVVVWFNQLISLYPDMFAGGETAGENIPEETDTAKED